MYSSTKRRAPPGVPAVSTVDLTRRESEISPLDAGLAEKFIGGLGLCVKLACDRIKPGTDPFPRTGPWAFAPGGRSTAFTAPPAAPTYTGR